MSDNKQVACEVCAEIVATNHICYKCAAKHLPQDKPVLARVDRQYVDLPLFLAAIKQVDEFKWDIGVDDNMQTLKLHLWFERFTMNPTGFHIGYEVWEAVYTCVRKYDIESNNMQKHVFMHWLVDVTEPLDFKCTDAPTSELCECESMDCDCTCELYTNPLDDDSLEDFGWQEFEHKLEQVLALPLMWQLRIEHNGEATWTIVNRQDKSVAYSTSDFVDGDTIV